MTASHSKTSATAHPNGASDQILDTVETNPLAVLAGGIAIGALAGALLPRSQRERDVLRPVGAKLGAIAVAALASAKEAGRSELDARGLTMDGAREKARGLFTEVAKAASTAGSAAAQSAQSAATGSEGAAKPATPEPVRTADPDPIAQTGGTSGFNSGN